MFTGPVNGYFGMMAQRFSGKNDDPVRDLPNGVTDAFGSYEASHVYQAPVIDKR